MAEDRGVVIGETGGEQQVKLRQVEEQRVGRQQVAKIRVMLPV